MYAPKIESRPDGFRPFERIRDTDALCALLHAAYRPRECNAHEHRTPLFSLVLKGALVEVDDANREYPCGPCSVVFNPAGLRHNDVIITPHITSFCFLIKPTLQARMEEHSDAFTRPAIFRSGPVVTAALRLQHEVWAEDTAADLVIQGLLYEIVGEMTRPKKKSKFTGAPPWVRTACEMIRDRCCDNVSIEQIAAAVGVHPSHLTRTFRTHLHETPGEYLRRIRLERATRLVSGTDRPLREIAAEAGFSDQAHFSREFKKEVGASPMEFRRTLRSN